jgi:hypothetical protein
VPEERKVYRRPARTAAPAPQAGQAAPRPDAPPPPKKKKRPGAKRRRSRLVLGLCLLCLLVVVVVSVVLVRCSAEEKGPAAADFGTPAAAWQKNDLGYYFNTSGRAMPAAVLKGMDVSKFQGEIDWEKAKAAGIDFAIIRCGFGGEWDGQEENWAQDDPQWRRNADECTRLGIPFGAYLYSYATTVEEARSEADHVARLLGLTVPEVQADREGAAVSLAEKYHCVAVLKGHHTLVAAPGGTVWRNETGNAGLAKGGSGDILAGLTAGLLAAGLKQGRTPEDAAVCAVWLHGAAADRCAKRRSMTAMLPGDLFEDLGWILGELGR